MPITSIIVEDESKSAELLNIYLREHCPDVAVLAKAQSIEEGLEAIAKHDPGLVFLDITLPDGNGFDLLDRLGTFGFDVIFTTAYNEYAIKAFEVSALHYLLKPIDIGELETAIDRYREKLKLQSLAASAMPPAPLKRIALPQREGLDFVEVEKIVRCEAEGNYTRFFLVDGKSPLVCKPLGKFEQLLADSSFFRTHKKHLVNMSFIQSYHRGKTGTLIMKDGSHIEVSPARRNDFFTCLQREIGNI